LYISPALDSLCFIILENRKDPTLQALPLI
jgi:hypothetical protein